MGYADLRRGRVSLRGHTYVVTTVASNRRPVFLRFDLGRLVVDALRHQDLCGATRTLAFVVMPDHLHWLLELAGNDALSQVVKRVKGITARRINQELNAQGHVWQPGFHDHAVRSDESLVSIARYVIMNPVRAKLVSRIGDYPLWDAAWEMTEPLWVGF